MSKIQTFQYLAGRLHPYLLEAHSYDQTLLKVSRAIYTVFRIYPGKRLLRFQDHIDRLEHSAAILEMPFPHHPAEIRKSVRLAVDSTDIQLPRICLAVPMATPDIILLMLQDFSVPLVDEIKQGVRVDLVHAKREKPSAKDSCFIFTRSIIREQYPNASEILMCDDGGQVLEGLSSNFFAVMHGELRTAQEHVLVGISRSILLEVATDVLPVHFKPVRACDLTGISEAFITSSSRGVMPVIEIGGIEISSGVPGHFTSKLSDLFDARVEAELESIIVS